MGKHRLNKISQTLLTARRHNQAGSAPQTPKAGQNGQN